ncbi:PREDICTED: uncharacterized protein F58A4.6 [Nicrophorus vespilloides]|uniref:Uncharacterized protein F58A4.6 n=1 Tax=Nicrophorus vespilloides TaxID=110193 RepID=A0ABM1M7Z5_NICVS|nr:PREDICTED: uncharacterized protein F58A4.6 [Nicrophorus vespilloides]
MKTVYVTVRGYCQEFDRFSVNSNGISDVIGCIGGAGEGEVVPSKKEYRVNIHGITLYYLVETLKSNGSYRIKFLENFRDPQINRIRFNLVEFSEEHEILDYSWNSKTRELVRERCELDNALSWLSTLGGAFSALGDYFVDRAKTAGKISLHQLQLALKVGDPLIAARCRLYFSLSLIQQGKYKVAKDIVMYEYDNAKHGTDVRLVRMCKGIWSKLSYERSLAIAKKTH